ncbi:MAG TPA: HAD-IA family hydrolase [Alphaproteobacteria bacterium]
MNNRTWLLLDFDNTMMETEKLVLPSLINRFNDLYGSQIDHPLTLDEFKAHFHGQARENLCANMSKHFNITVDCPVLYKDREWFVMQHLQNLTEGVTMAPEIIETLQGLKEQDYQFAFVSNNPIQRGLAAMRYASNKRGNELARFFGSNYFESGDKQKPLPDVYLRAMQQLGTDTDHCYAVEDSLSGLKAAVDAGIRTFAFGGFADDKDKHKTQMLENGAIGWFSYWPDFPALLPR